MKRLLSFATNTILLAVIIGATAFFLAPRFGLIDPIGIKIVRSGSMEPSIHTGSVVFIQKAASYQAGDIITFGADTRTSIPTTHRIISVQKEGTVTSFQTKGDANEDLDSALTPAHKVIGKVVFALPYAGYIFAFAKEPLGFALLVVTPAVLIILYEVINIYQEFMALRRRKKAEGALQRMALRTVDDLNDPRTKREPSPVVPHTRISSLHFDIEAPVQNTRFSP